MNAPRFLRFACAIALFGATTVGCGLFGANDCTCPSNSDAFDVPDDATWVAFGPPADGQVGWWLLHNGSMCSASEQRSGCMPLGSPGGPLPPPDLGA